MSIKKQWRISEKANEMLKVLMDDDFIHNEAMYIMKLISDEVKRRVEKVKTNDERRLKYKTLREEEEQEEEQEDNRLYPHPDQIMNAGKMITKGELEAWKALNI